MFSLPNYLRLDGPIGDSNGMDIGYLFATDKEAGEYWDDCREKWIDHVRSRRHHLEDLRKNGPIIGGQKT